ncbi:MAG TPA: orotidine-5'-phosphate decarboxylase [Pyrinomonadaceae bacterium]|nr:orotidine-5'-phosphate decarboxylase [Pyrinomonadaceae bacterium]
MSLTAKDKLIVALDVDSPRQAPALVNTLRDLVGMFKIGSQLFTAAGPETVTEIVRTGNRVFLDLKFHDIPNTVASAAVAATRLGVSTFNVHASGGREMMRRTADAVSEVATIQGLKRPSVIAVTVLTSSDATMLSEVGIGSEPENQVRRLSLLAEASGMDGVVASPHEVAVVRSTVMSSGFLIVTPGVRPAAAALDDQKRVMTPAQAIRAGADYIVVGRPITSAKDPVESAGLILEEMESGLG